MYLDGHFYYCKCWSSDSVSTWATNLIVVRNKLDKNISDGTSIIPLKYSLLQHIIETLMYVSDLPQFNRKYGSKRKYSNTSSEIKLTSV